jgi:beta-glucosidase
MAGRTYRYMTEKPLYPFGFGLSYTSFRFDSLKLSAPSITAGGAIRAAVTVTNTGKRDAEEVVQVYISKENRGDDEPRSSLRAFRRVLIPAGKTVSAEFELSAADFESVNAGGDSVLVPGGYTVYAGDAAPLPVSIEKGAPEPITANISVV